MSPRGSNAQKESFYQFLAVQSIQTIATDVRRKKKTSKKTSLIKGAVENPTLVRETRQLERQDLESSCHLKQVQTLNPEQITSDTRVKPWC